MTDEHVSDDVSEPATGEAVDASAETPVDAPPDLALLERVEQDMARVGATLAALDDDEVDPTEAVAWIDA